MIPEQQTVVLTLSQVARDLEALSRTIDSLDRAAVAAWSRHRRRYATAYLAAKGPVEDRKQTAVLEVEDDRLAAEEADQALRYARERIRVMRDRLEVGRSLNAAVRSQFAAEAVGQS